MTMQGSEFVALYYDSRSSLDAITKSVPPTLYDLALERVIDSGSHPDRIAIARMLLERKADPNWSDGLSGLTPLQNVILNSVPTVSKHFVCLLLEAKADVDYKGCNLRGRPLICCIHSVFEDAQPIGRLLIKAGAAPISKPEIDFHMISFTQRNAWYCVCARSMGLCLLACRATQRALAKTNLIHKDVIPLVCQHIWATRIEEEIWYYRY